VEDLMTDAIPARPGGGPLAGVRVLELGSMYAAPTCGRMLRDFGAEVIKVEDPISGDYARQWTPMKNGQSFGFARLNSGKRSVAIDLRRDGGRDLVRRLVAQVDVVIENFRPGRMDAWGLGYAALATDHPGIVVTSVSGFGQTGPYRAKPGFGTVAETGSGFASINGWPDMPPTSPPFGFADSIAGISAAMGTAMALFRRERTGLGDHVDVALYEPLMFVVGDMIMNYTGTGFIQGRVGNGTGSASPRGIYQAADGKWLSIAASNQGIAKRLFAAMGQLELIENPCYATNEVRMQHNDELQALVEGWVGERPRDEVLKILDEYEVVCSQVNDASDIVADPHFKERTLVELTGSEALGRVLMPGPVLHLAGESAPAYDGVPSVGEHTEEVLGELLSLTRADLAELARAGTVRLRPDPADLTRPIGGGAPGGATGAAAGVRAGRRRS
jgi:crotonobetainyl-CoA:carnitine CoA-transferase CaiB-like acyl-CoA transferase